MPFTSPLPYVYLFLLMSSQAACAANPIAENDIDDPQKSAENPSEKTQNKRPLNDHVETIVIDSLTDLKNNRQKWQKSGIVSYDYEYIQQCLDCTPVKTQFIALTIKQNQLDPIYDQRTQQPLTKTKKGASLIHTINNWFHLIEEKIKTNKDSFFSVDYYPVSGQPRQLFLMDEQAKKSRYFFRAAVPVKIEYPNASHNNNTINSQK